MTKLILYPLIGILFSACITLPKPQNQSQENETQAELDAIYSLLAYAIVAETWQTSTEENPRGYNIGCIIVNDKNQIVSHGLNSKHLKNNGTQHAEVVAIQSLLDQYDVTSLEGCTLYTTLEPCAQCAGMMTLNKLERVVFGQADPEFGNALERLQLDTSGKGGFSPYPRSVQAIQSTLVECRSLDEGYAEFKKYNEGSIIDFLYLNETRLIFELARTKFYRLETKHCENCVTLKEAKSYFDANFRTPVPQETNAQ